MDFSKEELDVKVDLEHTIATLHDQIHNIGFQGSVNELKDRMWGIERQINKKEKGKKKEQEKGVAIII